MKKIINALLKRLKKNKINRNRVLDTCLKDVACLPGVPLTNDEADDIQNFYSRYGIKPHLRFYEVIKGLGINMNHLFIPADIYYSRINKYFNSSVAWEFDDKGMYDQYFSDLKMPLVVAKKVYNKYFDSRNNQITYKEFERILVDNLPLILKKSKGIGCGSGIIFINCKKDLKNFHDYDLSNSDYIAQEIIHNHKELNWVNTKALCTLRVYTLKYYSETYVLATALRVGASDSMIDNMCAGGYVINVDEKTGQTIGDAFSLKTGFSSFFNGKCTPSGHKIPYYFEAVETCKKLSAKFPFALNIGWDIAITDSGFQLVECNLAGSDINIVQLACKKPYFGVFTKEILDKIFLRNIENEIR